MNIELFKKQIFEIQTTSDFERLAMKLFHFQYNHSKTYHSFCSILQIDPQKVDRLEKIPFLPIDFFRTQRISCIEEKAKLIFSSSGTTGSQTSFHEVPFPDLYENSFTKGFQHFYGDIEQYCILALLPSYLERNGSSLVYMAEHLIHKSNHPDSGFYLHNFSELHDKLQKLKARKQKTILLGVTYALLNLVADFLIDFPELIIMETGGMKGKRKEMIREDVHRILINTFHCPSIHSEYGMTELLSQAYSKGNGIYETPPWMKILIRDPNDPFTLLPDNHSGGINVIDLANVYSCAFISVQDIGKKHPSGSFEVLGRFDQSLVRGCNLLVI